MGGSDKNNSSLCFSLLKPLKFQNLYILQVHNTFLISYIVSFKEKRMIRIFYFQVQLVYTQVEGLYKGYLQWCNEEAKKGQKRAQMSLEDFIWLNGNGDLEDLSEALKTDEERTVGGPYLTRGKGRCSALVKITPDGSDLFVGQTTWNE